MTIAANGTRHIVSQTELYLDDVCNKRHFVVNIDKIDGVKPSVTSSGILRKFALHRHSIINKPYMTIIANRHFIATLELTTFGMVSYCHGKAQ